MTDSSSLGFGLCSLVRRQSEGEVGSLVVQEEKKSSRLKREAVEAVAVVVVLNVRNFCRKYTAVAASPGELQAARLCEEELVCM